MARRSRIKLKIFYIINSTPCDKLEFENVLIADLKYKTKNKDNNNQC